MEFDNVNIRNLSLELKVCFYLLGWGNNRDINSVDEWIDYAWHYYLVEVRSSEEKARSWAREEFNRLYDFVVKYII
jgi:hypothetical protein